jgi:regulator of replication initiation timing
MGAIKDITDLTIKLLESKDARKLSAELIKIQSLVATLQSEHAAIWEKNTQLQSENIRLKKKLEEVESTHRKEITALRGERDLRSQLSLEDNVYRAMRGEIEGYGTGPWCTNCFDTSGVLIALHHKVAVMIDSFASYKWECPSCKSSVSAPGR